MRVKPNLEKEKVVAFWDYESCRVPNEVDASSLQWIFHSSLKKGNFSENISQPGNVSVEVYGVTGNTDSEEIKEALRTGIFETFNVTKRSKDVINMALMVGIFKFIMKTPPPFTILLISSDGDFSYFVNKLRSYGYNTMVACDTAVAPGTLTGASNMTWKWNDFLNQLQPKDSREVRVIPKFYKPRSSNHVVGVFWDIVRCPCVLPVSRTLAYNIENSLTQSKFRVEGYSVEYYCYGDSVISGTNDDDKSERLRKYFRANLKTAGLDITDVSGISSEMKGFADLLLWCFHHPDCSVLLITNDDNYIDSLGELKAQGFQVMFAYVDGVDEKPLDKPTQKLLRVSNVVWSLSTFLSGGPPLSSEKLRLIREPLPVPAAEE